MTEDPRRSARSKGKERATGTDAGDMSGNGGISSGSGGSAAAATAADATADGAGAPQPRKPTRLLEALRNLNVQLYPDLKDVDLACIRSVAERFKDSDDAQLKALVKGISNIALREQAARQFEKEGHLHPETKMGIEGEGGFLDWLADHLGPAPSTDEVPIQNARKDSFEQEPDLAFAIFDLLVAIIFEHPGSFVDWWSPALSISVARFLVAVLEDAFKEGLILWLGTCVTEAEKANNVLAYEALVRQVEEWGYKGKLRIYFYHQEDYFASPHKKALRLISSHVFIAVNTSANTTDRGLGASTHMAEDGAAARSAPKSRETADVFIYDLRTAEGLRQLQEYHEQKKRVRSRNGFVWLLEMLVKEAMYREPIRQLSEQEKVDKIKEQIVRETRERLDQPVRPDQDINAYLQQIKFISASSSGLSGNGTGLRRDKRRRPHRPLATNEEAERIKLRMSESYTMMKQKAQVAEKPKRISKKRLIEEVYEEEGITEEQREHLAKQQKTKPLAATSARSKTSLPHPKHLTSKRRRRPTSKRDKSTDDDEDSDASEPQATSGSRNSQNSNRMQRDPDEPDDEPEGGGSEPDPFGDGDNNKVGAASSPTDSGTAVLSSKTALRRDDSPFGTSTSKSRAQPMSAKAKGKQRASTPEEPALTPEGDASDTNTKQLTYFDLGRSNESVKFNTASPTSMSESTPMQVSPLEPPAPTQSSTPFSSANAPETAPARTISPATTPPRTTPSAAPQSRHSPPAQQSPPTQQSLHAPSNPQSQPSSPADSSAAYGPNSRSSSHQSSSNSTQSSSAMLGWKTSSSQPMASTSSSETAASRQTNASSPQQRNASSPQQTGGTPSRPTKTAPSQPSRSQPQHRQPQHPSSQPQRGDASTPSETAPSPQPKSASPPEQSRSRPTPARSQPRTPAASTADAPVRRSARLSKRSIASSAVAEDDGEEDDGEDDDDEGDEEDHYEDASDSDWSGEGGSTYRGTRKRTRSADQPLPVILAKLPSAVQQAIHGLENEDFYPALVKLFSKQQPHLRQTQAVDAIFTKSSVLHGVDVTLVPGTGQIDARTFSAIICAGKNATKAVFRVRTSTQGTVTLRWDPAHKVLRGSKGNKRLSVFVKPGPRRETALWEWSAEKVRSAALAIRGTKTHSEEVQKQRVRDVDDGLRLILT